MPESLVLAARVGREEEAARALSDLGIHLVRTDDDFALSTARVRALTGIRTPDAVVLALAERERRPLGTLDARLARAARARGVEIVPRSDTRGQSDTR